MNTPDEASLLIQRSSANQRRFFLQGDEFYVDARILKWKPIATVFALSAPKSIDLFELRRRHPFLGWLVDAEYGSGTFIASDDQALFDVLVSTTGLLVRKRGALNVER